MLPEEEEDKEEGGREEEKGVIISDSFSHRSKTNLLRVI